MLIPTAPPAAAQTAFAVGLPTFLSGPAGLGSPAFGGLAPTLPSLAEIGTGIIAALPVFVLRSTDAATATVSISPASEGWQFFAGHNTGTNPQVISGTVVRLPPAHRWKMINLYYGDIVLSELGELQKLDEPSSFPQFAEQDYEARLLCVPVANLKAYWLRAQKAGETDYYVPIPFGAEQPIVALSGTTPYETSQFLAAIRPLAAGNLTIPPGFGA
jgi:hypothetical protein